MTSDGRPRADTPLDAALVGRLLAQQHPDLVGPPLHHATGGWDNEMFRLGDDLAVRLPRRASAARLLRQELRWLPGLARGLPLSVPSPLRTGEPALGYPYPWAVVRWLPGRTWALAPPTDARAAARSLGRFVSVLALPAPAQAPVNPFRGVPLAERDAVLQDRLTRWGARCPVDPAAVRRTWSAALEAPVWSGLPVWLHGDLHPANLIVHEGSLSGVVDFGDLNAGDPATDLAAAWTVVDAASRPFFREAARWCDEATWTRARGNALAHGVACLSGAADDPLIRRIGLSTLHAVLTDSPGRDQRNTR